MNQKQPVILPDGWEIIEGGLREDLPEVREWLAESQRQQYFPKGKDLGQQQQQQQQQRPMNSQERFDAFIQSQIQPREVDREGSLRLLQEAADNAPVPSTGIGNLVGGAFHGAANVGNHMLQAVKQPFRVSRAMFDPRYTMKDAGADWRRGIDEGAANDLAVLQRMPGGYDPSRDTAKATQWLGEAIASAPIGGGVAKGLGAGLTAAAPAVGRMAAPLLESMKTSGFGKMANGSIWNRMAGGAANSVASTAVVDPGSIGYDTAGLGAALPMIPVGARKVIAKSLNKWSAPTRTGPKFAQGDAKAMLDRGYKLTVGDIADSDNAKAFASQLNIIPWSGKAERKAHNQNLFDADVAKVVGANDLDEVRDGVIKARLDAKYDNFWNRSEER